MTRPSAHAQPLAAEPPNPAVLNELADDFLDHEQSASNVEADPARVAADPIRYADTTYFWHQEGDLEAELMRLYVETKYPGSDAKVVTEIPIQRLTELNNVIVMHRKGAPLINVIRNPNTGYQHHERVPPEERLNTVRESPIIAVAPFVIGASRYNVGKFDSNAFFDACAPHIVGGKFRIQAKENVIRYLPG